MKNKLIPKHQKGNKFINWFTNATIGAAMAENPAIMTASGWKQKDGQWEQKPTKESKQLAENIATISTFSPTNPATAIGDVIINKLIPPTFQLAKSYLKHPTWQTYYHGSPVPFNIKEAKMGTPYDMGLHFTKNKKVAKSFVDGSSSGVVYKFRAPRPKVTTSDLHDNGVQHLQQNYKLQSRRNYDFNIQDKQLLQDLKNSGIDYKITKNDGYGFIGSKNYYRLKLNQDININPRDRFLKVIPKNKQKLFNQKADEIINDFNKLKSKSGNQEEALSELNTRSSKLLDNSGITTVRYYNTNPYEGTIESYWINNPNKIDPLFNFKKTNTVYGISSPISSIINNIYEK